MIGSFSTLLVWNIVIAAILAIVVLAMSYTRFIKRRPALRHSLWVLVLVKLVTPPVIPLPVLANVEPPNGSTVDPVSEETEVVETEHNWPDVEFSTGYGASDAETLVAKPNVDAVEPVVKQLPVKRENSDVKKATLPVGQSSISTDSWLGATNALLTIWIFVSLVLLSRCWLQVRRLSKLLRQTSDGDKRLCNIMRIAARRMNVRNVGVRVVDAHLPPIIWSGWSEAFVVFPKKLADELSDDQLTAIVCHELAHHVRRDPWFNTFAMFVTAVCWWHPVAWLARREMQKAQELCCDEFAIDRCGVSRKSYLETLFQTLEFTQTNHLLATNPATGFGDGDSIKSRFKTLADGRQVHRNGWLTGAALLSLFACLLCLPVSAQVDDPETELQAFEMTLLHRLEGITTPMTHRSSFSSDGTMLAVGAGGQEDSRIYRVSDGTIVTKFDTENNSVIDLEFTPDGAAIASCGKNGVVLSDAKTGKEIRRFIGHTSLLVEELDISADGRRLVTGTTNRGKPETDATIRVWEIATGKQLHLIQLRHKQATKERRACKINSLEFSPDGRRVLASIGFYGSGRIETCGMVAEYNIETEDLARIICVESPENLPTFLGDEELPGEKVELSKSRAAAYSPDGKLIATGHEAVERVDRQWDDLKNCKIRLWDVESGELVRELSGHRSNVQSLEFSNDSARLVSCSWDQFRRGNALQSADHSVRVWEVASGKELAKVDLGKPGVSVRFSSDGRMVSSMGARRYQGPLIQVWRLTELDKTKPRKKFDILDPIKLPRPRPIEDEIAITTAQIETAGDAGGVSAAIYANRARQYAQAHEWSKSAADFKQAIELSPEDSKRWLRAGLSLLMARQQMSYEDLVQEMQMQFAEAAPNNIEHMVRMSVLPTDTIGMRESHEERIDKLVKENSVAYHAATQALVRYRLGKFDAALKSVAEAHRRNENSGHYKHEAVAMYRLIEAMCHVQLGDLEKAKTAYAAGDRPLRRRLADPDLIKEGKYWHNWIAAKILHDECRLVLRESEKGGRGDKPAEPVEAPKPDAAPKPAAKPAGKLDKPKETIRVIDGDMGSPIAGATFFFDPDVKPTNVGSTNYSATITSNKRGEVQLPTDTIDYLQFRVTHPIYLRSRFVHPGIGISGFGFLVKTEWPYGKVDGQKVIRLWRAETMTGQIRFADGKPVANMNLDITGEINSAEWLKKTGEVIWRMGPPKGWNTWATTDSTGKFTIAVPPQSIREDFRISSSSTLAGPFEKQVTDNDLGTIKIDRGVVVHGTMVDLVGNPVKKTLVSISLENRKPVHGRPTLSRNTYTDENGRFELAPVAAGSHILRPIACLPQRLELRADQRKHEVNVRVARYVDLKFDVVDRREQSPGVHNVSLWGDVIPDDGKPIPYLCSPAHGRGQSTLTIRVPTELKNAELRMRNFPYQVVRATDGSGMKISPNNEPIKVRDLASPPKVKFWLDTAAPLWVDIVEADTAAAKDIQVTGQAIGKHGVRKLGTFIHADGKWRTPGLYEGEQVEVTVRRGNWSAKSKRSEPIRLKAQNHFQFQLPEKKITEVMPRDGVFFTWTGYMTTIIEFKDGRFRYWFESDAKSLEEPEYPLKGEYSIEGDTVTLTHEQISQKKWKFRSVNGVVTLWRMAQLDSKPEDGLKMKLGDLQTRGGGSIIVQTDQDPAALWKKLRTGS